MIRTKEHDYGGKTKIWKYIFLIYIFILVKMIVFKYPLQSLVSIMGNWEKGIVLKGISGANFVLGKSIRMYIRYFHKFSFWNGFANLIGNVLVFIPYGILLPKAYPVCGKWWRVTYCAVGFVTCIELFQLLSGLGIFDVDDILLNVLGSVVGYGLFALAGKIRVGKRVRTIMKNGKK